MTGWDDLLHALEHRTDLLEDALGRGDEEPGVLHLDLAAEGPLPAHLRLRAAVLLARTRQLEQELARRTGAAARARAAYASH